jgi:transketolase
VSVREVRSGGEIGLVGTGLGTRWALEAAELLDGRAGVLHVPVLKPLDSDAIVRWCGRFEEVTTVENHSIIGGLGSAVAEALTEAGVGTRLRRLGVPDRWAPAGSLEYIRAELGLDADGIASAVR